MNTCTVVMSEKGRLLGVFATRELAIDSIRITQSKDLVRIHPPIPNNYSSRITDSNGVTYTIYGVEVFNSPIRL